MQTIEKYECTLVIDICDTIITERISSNVHPINYTIGEEELPKVISTLKDLRIISQRLLLYYGGMITHPISEEKTKEDDIYCYRMMRVHVTLLEILSSILDNNNKDSLLYYCDMASYERYKQTYTER